MLHDAVRKHEQKHAQGANPLTMFARNGSVPSQNPGSSAANPTYRNPLRPTPTSSLNAQSNTISRQQLSGVKRTSNGLAKALSGSFETSTPKPHTSSNDLPDGFDENDFDDDLDLDDIPPAAKARKEHAYPRLPNVKSIAKQTFSPTIPRHQSIQSAMMGTVDPPLRALEPHQDPPQSSGGQIEWSSSPSEHHKPAASNLKQFSYFAPKTAQPSHQTQELAPPRPTGRRHLPWAKADPDESAQSSQPYSATLNASSLISTPAAKESVSMKNTYLWNTTASAVKEQQKKHREDGKKAAIKVNELSVEDARKVKMSRARPARVFLSEEQQHVLNLVTEKGASVFFTGSAGTGKSVLMREIITSLRQKYKRESDRVAVTASTGLAACNVGGVTLHSFAGIGLGKEDVPELIRKINRNQKAKHRWKRTKILVVDEISMVDGDLFDKLEQIARAIRGNARAFGGMQLVITGDFFQLPPVPDHGRVAKFAFDAMTWNTTIEHTIGLHHVFRQKDPVFAGMLNEMREGRLSESSIKAFRSLERNPHFEDDIHATELFPTRNEVDRANNTRLGQLMGKPMIFEARDGGTITDKGMRDKLLQNCLAPELITLKKGAQVMLIKNVDESLVNGSIGKVIGFMSESRFDQYHQNEDGEPDSLSGETTDLGNALEERAKNRMMGITTAREFPVVRFTINDGSTRDLLCQPEPWKVELPNGEVQASRLQVPLILAWALSIHKAQGQTLERVKVDLGKVFEKGQAYVALSRATSMAGLQILRFDPKKVNAHDKVRTFYQNLDRIELEMVNKPVSKKQGTSANDYERRFVDD